MANQNRPKGLVPVRHKNGSPWNQQTTRYYIPSTDTNAYYFGDLVKSAADADADGVPQVVKAAAGDTVRGVIVGTTVTGDNLDILNIPATKTRDYYVYVVDDPSVVFELQDDGAATLTAAAANKNANFKVAVPTAPANQSATTLDSTTPNTTQALPLRILGLRPNQNTPFGAYSVWYVMINQHELMGNTAGV